jgi:hypothetical protein
MKTPEASRYEPKTEVKGGAMAGPVLFPFSDWGHGKTACKSMKQDENGQNNQIRPHAGRGQQTQLGNSSWLGSIQIQLREKSRAHRCSIYFCRISLA